MVLYMRSLLISTLIKNVKFKIQYTLNPENLNVIPECYRNPFWLSLGPLYLSYLSCGFVREDRLFSRDSVGLPDKCLMVDPHSADVDFRMRSPGHTVDDGVMVIVSDRISYLEFSDVDHKDFCGAMRKNSNSIRFFLVPGNMIKWSSPRVVI